MLQNGMCYDTKKWYVLQNGMSYTTVRVKQRFSYKTVLHNGTSQNRTCY
jgi:hypothetical protein